MKSLFICVLVCLFVCLFILSNHGVKACFQLRPDFQQGREQYNEYIHNNNYNNNNY